MFDSLLDALGNAWWAYPLILVFCVFDSVITAVPSEIALLTGGILAADGRMVLWGVIVMAALGGFVGDNLAYWLGRSAQRRARRLIARGERGTRWLERAEREVGRHGGVLVIVARFVPGGRTATTVACGVLRFGYRQFLAFDAVGATLWATVHALIGYLGGRAFADNTLAAFTLSFGVALALSGTIELIRWLLRRRDRASEV